MANSITRTYTFANGGVADGGQVDTEVSGIVNTINNADAGTTTWTAVKGTTITATTLVIGANTFAYVPPTSYTPTFSAGWGVVTAISVRYSVMGKEMHIWGQFTCGVVAASVGTITLPSTYTIDTNNISNGDIGYLGVIFDLAGAVSAFASRANALEVSGGGANPTIMTFAPKVATGTFTPANVSTVIGNNEVQSFDARFPVLGP